jgi:hypothetical protein
MWDFSHRSQICYNALQAFFGMGQPREHSRPVEKHLKGGFL